MIENSASTENAPILVGYDGSPAAGRALGWAVAEAELRQTTVTVLQSWREPVLSDQTWLDRWSDPTHAERAAADDLERAITQASAAHPDVTCTSMLVLEPPADALIAAAETHQLVVVGPHGRAGVGALALGSVAERVADRAPTTVVVVRGMPTDGGPIVVGVDGSRSSRLALRWAAEEGCRRGRAVQAVLAWTALVPVGPHGPEPFGAAATAADARLTLHRIVAEELGRHHASEVRCETAYDGAARALIDGSNGAALLVVGGAEDTDDRRHHVTSVGRQVLRRSFCPVVITR